MGSMIYKTEVNNYFFEKKPFISPVLQELIDQTFDNFELYKKQILKESTNQLVLCFEDEVINNVK